MYNTSAARHKICTILEQQDIKYVKSIEKMCYKYKC